MPHGQRSSREHARLPSLRENRTSPRRIQKTVQQHLGTRAPPHAGNTLATQQRFAPFLTNALRNNISDGNRRRNRLSRAAALHINQISKRDVHSTPLNNTLRLKRRKQLSNPLSHEYRHASLAETNQPNATALHAPRS
ncbi:MAG: hypothetical protein [Microviridae sp.]|nr:MAG: hypothetical protein [Microviridae sp.]